VMPAAVNRSQSPDREGPSLAASTKEVTFEPVDGATEKSPVSVEELKPQEWAEKVYKPDIVNNSEELHKKPGYTM
jgi:4-oxalocrotonate tautomerase